MKRSLRKDSAADAERGSQLIFWNKANLANAVAIKEVKGTLSVLFSTSLVWKISSKTVSDKSKHCLAKRLKNLSF